MSAAAVVETATSASYASANPALTVIVSTFRRSRYLPGLLAALEAQDAANRIEAIIVDNGSGDDTWSMLCAFAAATPLAVLVARVEDNHGPAPARSAAVNLARAPRLGFTDDDCMPESAWTSTLLAAFDDGARVIQGRTEPEAGRRDTWDRTMTIRNTTSLFETCNVAYQRDDVVDAGAFRPLPDYQFNGAPFGGEDTVLGWKIVRATGAPVHFLDDALVRHRIEPGSFKLWLRMRRGTNIFPALIREVPEIRRSLFLRTFLTARSASFDLGVLSIVTAAALRSPWALVGLTPYVVQLRPRRHQRFGAWVKRTPAAIVGDATAAFALARGSLRYKRVVL